MVNYLKSDLFTRSNNEKNNSFLSIMDFSRIVSLPRRGRSNDSSIKRDKNLLRK